LNSLRILQNGSKTWKIWFKHKRDNCNQPVAKWALALKHFWRRKGSESWWNRDWTSKFPPFLQNTLSKFSKTITITRKLTINTSARRTHNKAPNSESKPTLSPPRNLKTSNWRRYNWHCMLHWINFLDRSYGHVKQYNKYLWLPITLTFKNITWWSYKNYHWNYWACPNYATGLMWNGPQYNNF
jgi:hypothetical protein